MDDDEIKYKDCVVMKANGYFDAPQLYEDLRIIDILEVIGLGNHPRLAVCDSYALSDEAWTILDPDHRMIGSFGIARSGVDGMGVPWMLCTHRVHLIKRSFIKYSKEWLNRLFNDKYHILTNYVMNENELSIRWLKWLGASFNECSIEGYQQFSFHKS
jgi:hypothetical protein